VQVEGLLWDVGDQVLLGTIATKSAVSTFVKPGSTEEGQWFSVTIQDKSGTIVGKFFNNAVEDFYDILEENKTYKFNNFKLRMANKNYDNSSSIYELNFDERSSIEEA
jgi:replication factor A1